MMEREEKMAILVVTRTKGTDELIDAEKFAYTSNALSYLNQLNTECPRDGIYYAIEDVDPRGSFADVVCCDVDEEIYD